jgi:hypothetical protein
MENNNRDIIKSSLSSPMKEIFTDVAEMGLDEILEKLTKEQKVLKDIPIIKWLFVVNDIRTIIQSVFFIRKYANFIGIINESMEDDLINDDKLLKIFSDKKVFSELIDRTLIALDRYQTIQKGKVIAKLFIETFKKRNFTVKEYNTLLFSIENIHPSLGFECLKSFYEYKCEINKEEDKERKDKIWAENSSLDYSPLATSGLVKLPDGGMYIGSYGGAFINELGFRFYELVVSKI